VSTDGTMTYREVKVADDDGKIVSLLSGVTENEMVALNLGNNLASGTHVRPVPMDLPPAAPATAPASTAAATPASSSALMPTPPRSADVPANTVSTKNDGEKPEAKSH